MKIQGKFSTLFDNFIKDIRRNIENIGFKIFIVLFFLILTRIVSVILYYNGVPANSFHDIGLNPDVRGDQFEYFRVALNFSKLQFTETQYPIGLPLLLIPFIYLFNATTLADIFMPVSIFNSVILFSASILLIYGIANKITGDNKIALLASTLWVLFSYKLSNGMWVWVLSEPPTIFVILLAIYLYLRGNESKTATLKYPLVIGMLTAFGVWLRIPNSLFVLFFVLMYAFERKLKHCIIFLASTLVFLIPQFAYNNIAYHTLATTGYTVGGSVTSSFSINYVIPFFDELIGNSWLYSLFGLLVFSTIGILYLLIVLKDKSKVFFLAIWLYSFFAAFSVTSWYSGGLGRYLAPSYPAVVICIASFVVIGFHSAKAIIWDLFKGEMKNIRKFIIVVIPILFLLFAGVVSPHILSERQIYNLNNAEDESIEYSGWYATSTGLWLKPGTSGTLVYETKIKQYPYTYLSLSFYNPGTNRLEISTDGGKTYDVMLENKTSEATINITKYIYETPSVLLRFTASNFRTQDKIVISRVYIHYVGYRR